MLVDKHNGAGQKVLAMLDMKPSVYSKFGWWGGAPTKFSRSHEMSITVPSLPRKERRVGSSMGVVLWCMPAPVMVSAL